MRWICTLVSFCWWCLLRRRRFFCSIEWMCDNGEICSGVVQSRQRRSLPLLVSVVLRIHPLKSLLSSSSAEISYEWLRMTYLYLWSLQIVIVIVIVRTPTNHQNNIKIKLYWLLGLVWVQFFVHFKWISLTPQEHVQQISCTGGSRKNDSIILYVSLFDLWYTILLLLLSWNFLLQCLY